MMFSNKLNCTQFSNSFEFNWQIASISDYKKCMFNLYIEFFDDLPWENVEHELLLF